MYPSHWLYPLYSKMLLCFTYVSQSLVVPSALEDAHVFDVCIPVIGCTLCTRRCSCVWRQSLVVPSALEDTPVFYVCIPVIGCTLCTRRCSCVWRMYPSHWLYPLYSKMLMCLTYVSQSLVVPSALEDAHVFDVCIPVIGCTLCTRRCSCVWRMYPRYWLYPPYSKMLLWLTYVSQSLVVPSVIEDAHVFDDSHWLYPLHSKMLLCLTYVSQSLVVPSALEDAHVFDDSHWLYPLHSKILMCLTYVSQSLVVPSVLEDTPVFDVCIPVIGCTLCTRRCSCVWRQSLVVPSVLEDTPVFDVCIPVIGCTLCTRRCSCVWRMYPSHWLYPLHSKMLMCLTYVSQSLVVPSVLEDTPVFDVCIPVIGCTLCTRRCSCVWRQSLVVPSTL